MTKSFTIYLYLLSGVTKRENLQFSSSENSINVDVYRLPLFVSFIFLYDFDQNRYFIRQRIMTRYGNQCLGLPVSLLVK